MATKQINGLTSPDGGHYVTLTDGAGNLTGSSSTGIPAGATFVSNSVQGTTNATAATLPAAVGKTTYICGFSIRSNATAGVTGFGTVAGILGGTLSYNHFTQVNTSGMGAVDINYTVPLPANNTNTTIVVTCPAPGAGGTCSVCAWGFQL